MGNYDKCTINQKNAILHDNGNMLVSASAGSGKTMVVIQRILRLITENNVDVSKILAVTFTNAAASEMKEKLKKEILSRLSEKNDEFLKEQLEKVNTASISTIHSFCYDLIKKYFFELGLDASVKLIDEKESDKLSSEAISNLFDRYYEEGNREFFEALEFFTQKRKDRKLRETILKLYKFSIEESDLNAVYEKTKIAHENAYSYLVERVFNPAIIELHELESKIDAVIGLCDADLTRKQYLIDLKEQVLLLQTLTTPKEVVSSYQKKSLPKAGKLSAEVYEQLKAVKSAVDKVVESIGDANSIGKEEVEKKASQGLKIADKLFWLTSEFILEYEKIKAENNVLDFADLQKCALKLLENADILNAERQRYEYVFVDEYQDVNDIQEKIVTLISKDNLFMVGDSKQSIYAFRGCNPKFFVDKFKRFDDNEGGTAVSLDNNFRSSNAVITSVNKIFSDVFTPEFSGLNYAKSPMIYGGLYKDFEGSVVYHLINGKTPPEKKQVKGVYSVVENYEPIIQKEYGEESALVVKLINEIVGTKYYDIKAKVDEGENPIKEYTYGDICILSRSNSELVSKVVSALIDFKIPVTVGGKNKIADYPEIKVLISLVSSLCFINQDVPLATVMLNLWDFSEDELSLIRKEFIKEKHFYDCIKKYSKLPNILGEKISRFLADIDRIRLVAEFVSANEILTRIVSETEWDAKLLAEPFGAQKLKRVERFIAESMVGESKMNIKEFNDYIEKSIEDITITETAGDNTVRFMTEHSSKGLEFPCVIVIGADTKYNEKDLSGDCVFDREYGVIPKIFEPEVMIKEDNPLLSVVKSGYYLKRAVEEARVLYVALTRAKCDLHVIAKAENVLEFRDESAFKRAVRPADFLSRQDAKCIVYNGDDLTIEQDSEGTVVAGKNVNPNLSNIIRENLTYSYPHLSDTVIPLKTSVSNANKHLDDEYYETISIFTGDSAERGTAYHKVLEKCDFYASDLSAEVDRVLLEHFTLTERELVDKQKVLDILNMDIFKSIKGSKLIKEKKFCCLVEGNSLGYTSSEKVLVQGIIDLMCETDSGIILIDYKLSTISSEQDLVKKYKKQMDLYRYAIETISGKKVINAYLVNILQNKVVEL